MNKQQRSSNYWNHNTVIEESKKYKTLSEFRKAEGGGYFAARKNKWIEELTWLKRKQKKPSNYWTHDTVLEESKKYKTIKEFSKSCVQAYRLACKNKWIEELTWLRTRHPKKYWTHERVLEVSKLYTTKKDFKNNNHAAYVAAYKNKWIEELTWLQDERFDLYKDKIDSVYAYEFQEYNSVYIGRTLIRVQQKRARQHTSEKSDAVYLFAYENNIIVPDMKILEDNLTLEEGKAREGYWVEDYKSRGWNILNRAKTGSIGSLGKGMWNYERTKNEAMKYRTKKEFERGNGSAYAAAIRNGWIKDYTWFVSGHTIAADKKRIWTYEKTKEEADKYSRRVDFQRGSPRAYDAAQRNGWLDQLFNRQ